MVDSFLERVIAKTATLEERLSSPLPVATPSTEELGIVEKRLEVWRNASVGGDLDLFGRRLTRDGIDINEAILKLSVDRPSFGNAPWIETATWVERALREGAGAEFTADWRGTAPEVPFEDLISGVIEQAEHRLVLALPPEAIALLSPAARATFRLELAQALSDLCGPAFYERWKLTNARGADRDPGSFAEFKDYMRRQGLRVVFGHRPVLLRLLASVTQQWIESTAEFVSRLHSDQSELDELTRTKQPLVVAYTRVMGDLHNHGRAVRHVIFENGAKVFYKPKDLAIDRAWSDLVAYLNKLSPPVTLRAVLVQVRSDYGWAECVEHESCRDAQGLANYFHNAGAWLCLFHLFSGMDMHEQNIVASGEDPVPVDLETLLQPSQAPEVSENDPRRAYSLAGAAIANSVLSTGLLPAYGRGEGRGEAIAHGGFLETRSRERRIEWLNVNTDEMRPVIRWDSGRANQNRPHIFGRYGDIKDFVEEVTTGFEQYAKFMRGVVRAYGDDALLGRFRNLRVRKLLKNTRFYALLLDRLKDPRNLTDGVIWSAQLDFVCRMADWKDAEDPWWPLVAAERNALAELNIPYFFMSTLDSTIRDVDGLAANGQLEPAIDRVSTALRRLDDAEIQRQTDMVRLSLSSVRPVEESLALRHRRRSRCVGSEKLGANDNLFKARADTIAQMLATQAYRGRDSAAWLGLDWLQDSSICQLAPIGADLYNGAIGVAIFLAAHAKVCADERSASLAKAALSAVRDDLLGANTGRAMRAFGIGGSTGLGSVVYGLSVVAELTNDRALLSDVVRISQLITDVEIAADTILDAMDGSAGALLGLLKAYRLTAANDVLERARACGHHLLAAGFEASTSQVMRSGLSHGPAGVVLALASLAAVCSGEEAQELLRAAETWLDIENATFCSAKASWPDARSLNSSEDGFWPCQWCHGAAGIGLARLATAERLRMSSRGGTICEAVDNDIYRAVAASKGAWPYPTDSLCCGSLGGIELLAEAGRYFNDLDLGYLARERLSEVVAEADIVGDYLWDIGDRSVNIGLFRGVSGVGYTLLRHIDPILPNVMVWG